jgi:CHASE2 domain-containing sensor protein
MKSLLKIFRGGIFWFLQIALIIVMTIITKNVLETIPVPGVFKSLSIIQLDDLNSSVLQSAADLKSTFTIETGIDSMIKIINIETTNPLVKRDTIAAAIRFLKDYGAKTIALNFTLDTPSTIHPEWDIELANAIKYANNVIVMNALNPFINENKQKDTSLTLRPSCIFDTVLTGAGYANLDPPDSKDNPGGVIQYYYPNQDFKGYILPSFAMQAAKNFDSNKTKALENYTDKLYINFYQDSLFQARTWNISWVINPALNESMREYVKGRLFIFGYINDENDVLKSSMFATAIGKQPYAYVYASLISDMLKQKIVLESSEEVDYAICVFICLFNLGFIAFASRKTLMWEKFTGALLVLVEVFILYFLVIAVYILFNYELSVIIMSIVCFVSVPTITLLKNRILPLYNKYIMYTKIGKYPYPIIQPYMSIFEPEKRSIRHMSVVYGFQRLFWQMSALSICSVEGEKWIEKQKAGEANTLKSGTVVGTSPEGLELKSEICFPSLDVIHFNNWDELKEYNLKYKHKEINRKILEILNSLSHIDILNNRIIPEYDRLFNPSIVKQELFIRAEDEKDIHPYQDTFPEDKNLFRELIYLFASVFSEYNFIYVAKGGPGKYLIRSLRKASAPASYIKTQKTLLLRNVYLASKKDDIYIPLSPYLQYRMCQHHYKRELFVFSNRGYNSITGEPECNFNGEYFMCSPLDHSVNKMHE